MFQLNDVNLWPPFSVTVTPLNNTQPCNMTAPDGFATSMLPFYYIPATHQRSIQTHYTDSITPSGFQGKYNKIQIIVYRYKLKL